VFASTTQLLIRVVYIDPLTSSDTCQIPRTCKFLAMEGSCFPVKEESSNVGFMASQMGAQIKRSLQSRRFYRSQGECE
jgi:hypothetical protein